jgi:high-affinity Fe2+/Pb2+ permease
VAALAGIVLILFMFKTGKLLTKLLFFLIAAGLFAGAYWWHTHK